MDLVLQAINFNKKKATLAARSNVSKDRKRLPTSKARKATIGIQVLKKLKVISNSGRNRTVNYLFIVNTVDPRACFRSSKTGKGIYKNGFLSKQVSFVNINDMGQILS